MRFPKRSDISRRKPRTRADQRLRRLAVEPLEDRRLLAVTVTPSSPTVGNCYPFGGGNTGWSPHVGFVYQNVPAFSASAGDVLAFDLGAVNDQDIQLDISLAPTTVNGGDVAAVPFTKVVSNTQTATVPRGDTIIGNFELAFAMETSFNFAGGGLIIRFSNPAGAHAADSTCNQVLVRASSSDPSGQFVKRFYQDADGLAPYSLESPDSIGGFRILGSALVDKGTSGVRNDGQLFGSVTVTTADARFGSQSLHSPIGTAADRMAVTGPITDLDMTSAYSFMTWVRRSGSSIDDQGLVVLGSCCSPREGYTLNITAGNELRFYGGSSDDDDNYNLYSPAGVLDDGLWHHVGARANGSAVQLLVDGVVVASTSTNVPTRPSLANPNVGGVPNFHGVNNPHIGGDAISSGNGANVYIDEVRVYSSYLDDTQWAAAMNNTGALPDRLYYDFEGTVADQPPVAHANGPYVTTEGTGVTLDATGSSDDVGIVQYEWDLDYTGTFTADITTASAMYALPAPPDDFATRNIALRVTDTFGQTALDTTTLTVNNLPPTITSISVPPTAVTGVMQTFSATASDPGVLDVLTYTWTVTRPDSTIINLVGSSVNFTPATTGPYTVALVVTDGDGGSDSDSAGMAVAGTVLQIIGGDLVIFDAQPGGKDDLLTISRDGTDVVIHDPHSLLGTSIPGAVNPFTHTVRIPLTAFGGGIVFHTLDGDDSLEVSFSPDNHTRPITFHGGDQNNVPQGDTLSLSGGGVFSDAVFNYFNASDGSIDVSGNSTIMYTGLEPISSTITALNVELNYGGGGEMITITDAGGGQTMVVSTAGEMTTFDNPTNSLAINAGGGPDLIQLNSLAANYPASITIDGQADSDTLQINGAISLSAGRDFTAFADQIIHFAPLTTTGTGAVTLDADRLIVLTPGSSISTVEGGVSLENNAAGTATGNFVGVRMVSASVSSTGSGPISVTGRGGDDAGSSGHHGLFMDAGSSITSSGTGPITLTGLAGDGIGGNHGVFVAAASSINSTSGNIQIQGAGGDGTSTFNVGVRVDGASSVVSNGSATIQIEGSGGTGTDRNAGVMILGGNTAVRSAGGALTIMGTGGAGTGVVNAGVLVDAAAVVESTATGPAAGTVRLEGQGGTGTTGNNGVTIFGNGTRVQTVDGDLELEGMGGGSGTNILNHGVLVDAGALVASTGAGVNAGTITLTGTGGTGTDSSNGVDVANTAAVTSIDGNIEVTGQGGSGSGNLHHGVILVNNARLESTGTASITVDGTGGTGNNANHGLVVSQDSRVSSPDGDIELTGQGGSGPGSNHLGVLLTNGGLVESTGAGAGAATITIDGTGGAGGIANRGVQITGGPTAVTSIDGAIQILGLGGPSATDFHQGVFFNGGRVTATGSAPITIQGTAGPAAGLQSPGIVFLSGGNALISSVDGDIQIVGTGDGTGTGSGGIVLDGGNTVRSSGAGQIQMTGTGAPAGNGRGVAISAGALVEATGSGNIVLAGDGSAAAPGVHILGTVISNTGTVDAVSEDAFQMSATGLIDSASGTVTVIADNAPGSNGGPILMSNGALIDAGSGNVRMTADGDVFLGGIVTTAQVVVTSLSGGILDGGAAHLEIQANSAALRAATGIGSADALDTNLNQLAALNLASGLLRVDNSAGGLLQITTVDGLAGVVNSGPDAIRLAADDLDVVQPISATTGNIDLISSHATRTIGLGSAGPVKGSGFDGTTAAFALTDAELDLITTGGSRQMLGGSATDLFNVHYGGADTQPLTVLGFAGEDQFFVAPSSTMPFNLDGGTPSPPTLPGDTLHLDMSGAVPVVIVDTIGGYAISASTATINFVEMETLDLCDDSGDIDNADIGDLYVRTTDDNERITFTSWNDTGVKLRIDNLTAGTSTTYPQHFGLVGGLQMLAQLLVYAQGGDDLVSVAAHVIDAGLNPIPVEFHGEEGNDYLTGANADDILVGGPGNDRVLGGEGNNQLFGDGNQFDMSGQLIEALTDGDDYLAGRGGADRIWGGGANDRLIGGDGNDVLNGGSGDDLLDGGHGTDILRGQDGRDTLSGGFGHDVLLGGAGNDQLFGQQDNDLLIGGTGADYLRGDAGNDLLIAGTTAQDNATDAALLALLAAWSGGGIDNTSGHAADADRDTLLGDTGVDAFWADILPLPAVDTVVSESGELVQDEP